MYGPYVHSPYYILEYESQRMMIVVVSARKVKLHCPGSTTGNAAHVMSCDHPAKGKNGHRTHLIIDGRIELLRSEKSHHPPGASPPNLTYLPTYQPANHSLPLLSLDQSFNLIYLTVHTTHLHALRSHQNTTRVSQRRTGFAPLIIARCRQCQILASRALRKSTALLRIFWR